MRGVIYRLVLGLAVLVLAAGLAETVGAEAGTVLKASEFTLYANREYKLVNTIEDLPCTSYRLFSSDREVAVVSKLGRVMSLNPGTCTITAVLADGSEETCQVTVLSGDTKRVQVALTFDDGPGSYGMDLMNFLEERNVHVSFFLIGKSVASFTKNVKRMFNDGHEVGNHSFTHPQLTKLKEDTLRAELEDCNEAVYKAAGAYPTIMRPPYGSYNDKVRELSGVPIILWNIDTLDWKYRDADYVCDQIVSGASDGNIILVHEIHKTTIEGAKKAIDILLKKGVEFVTVSELLTRDGSPSVAGERYSQKR